MSITDQVQDFTMSLREQLMEYYKGSCGTQFHSPALHDLSFVNQPLNVSGRRAFQYERRDHELHRPVKVHFRNSPLMKLTQHPDEVVFYMQVFQRSPQLTEVHRQLKQFFEQYLSGVTLKENNKLYSLHSVPDNDDGISPTSRHISPDEQSPRQGSTYWITSMEGYPLGMRDDIQRATDARMQEGMTSLRVRPQRVNVIFDELGESSDAVF